MKQEITPQTAEYDAYNLEDLEVDISYFEEFGINEQASVSFIRYLLNRYADENTIKRIDEIIE